MVLQNDVSCGVRAAGVAWTCDTCTSRAILDASVCTLERTTSTKGAKAMKFEQYEYTIGPHFLSALINGDTSGLSDVEEKELDEWLESLGHSDGHWATTDDHDEFGRCDVTNLRGSVETVVYNEVINETT